MVFVQVQVQLEVEVEVEVYVQYCRGIRTVLVQVTGTGRAKAGNRAYHAAKPFAKGLLLRLVARSEEPIHIFLLG